MTHKPETHSTHKPKTHSTRKLLYKSNNIKCGGEADTLTREMVQEIEQYLYKHSMRDGCTFAFCNQTALRASDLLSLKVQDLFNFINGIPIVKDEFAIFERKTHKRRIIETNDKAKRVLQEYYEVYKDEINRKGGVYLFPSRSCRRDSQGNKYYTGVTVSSYDRILRQAKKDLGYPDYLVISSHSSRKTVGNLLYKECKVPIEQIQMMFGHSSPGITFRYIGVNKRESQKLYHKIEL